MENRIAVWDWNGTLLDDVEVCLDTVNEMLEKRGLARIANREMYQNMFTFPVIEYYRKAGFDLSAESFEVLSEEYMAGYHRRAVHCGLFADVREAVFQLRSLGIPSVILSASHRDHLRLQTDQCGCTDWFDQLIGTGDIYAREKISAAWQWISENPELKKCRMVMIGDSLHDGEVARSMGWDCVLTDRGHQSHERLAASGFRVCSGLKEVVTQIISQE